MKFLLCLLAGMFFFCGCSAPEDVSFGENFASISLTVPGGWSYEVVPVGETDFGRRGGVEFWRDDAPDVRMGLYYHADPYGICGTGPAFEECTFSSGHTATLTWENLGETTNVQVFFDDTPGQYVFYPEQLPTTFWEDNRETILAVLDTAKVGAGAITKSEALAIAQAECPKKYPYHSSRFDHVTGEWTFDFFAATVILQTVVVSADGSIK